MMRYPDTLPLPQAPISYGGPSMSDTIEVLCGPSRRRLGRRFAPDTCEFELWLTAAQAREFEAWYDEAVELHDGELYVPWFANGRVSAFVDSYSMVPHGTGWRLSGLIQAIRLEPEICEEHIGDVFSLVDADLDTADVIESDLTSATIVADDFPLELISEEEC